MKRKELFAGFIFLMMLAGASSANFIIEDGTNIADWADLSGGYNVITQSTDVPSGQTGYSMQVATDRESTGSNAIEWTTASGANYDWTQYDTIQFWMKTDSTNHSVQIRWRNDNVWNSQYALEQVATNTDWNLYSLDITSLPRDKVDMFFIYLPTDVTQQFTTIFYDIELIPEPLTVALLGIGGGAILLRHRKRRKN